MDEDKNLIIIVVIGGAVIVSALLVLLMYLYFRRRNASQPQTEPEKGSTKTAATEKVLEGKAGRILRGESRSDRLTRLNRDKTKNSSQNGSAGYPPDTTDATSSKTEVNRVCYENVEMGGLHDQVENESGDMLDTVSPPNEDAGMEGDVATSTPPNEDTQIKDDNNPVTSPSQNEDANMNDDPHTMQENEIYVSADEVKGNQGNPVMHYEAESGDIYAGVLKSKKSMTDKSP